ncbi:dUTP diphosphatase [Sutcliffiella horikoshii]|uniref:dUTP diphosphatase n=1 Tax=Sutcliffiella horikoshii TaxID=79883 RepID=UPI002041E871|nr:dUTP diphosphatase [Sutcliffiella horikoshii]MCM3619394.1 dUTP diphosphatase [Sutcliffiella horikoshii]
MNLHKLYDMQRELDEKIETQHGLLKENLVEEKILALLVELGELANETRCFKFWSVKPPAEQKVILEEYVDGVHFILSLGLTFGYGEEVSRGLAEQAESLTGQFNSVYHLISIFKTDISEENYRVLVDSYMQLGEMLGFSWGEVEDAYLAKNKVNHDRQAQGY